LNIHRKELFKPELLAPAGNAEKLRIAINYGADAVYLSGQDYGLRSAADNFSPGEMQESIRWAHNRGKKVYVAANASIHEKDLKNMPDFIENLKKASPDGVIVSDPGILELIKNNIPKAKIILSTQANTTNSESARFWKAAGVDRIILARELSFEEVKRIIENVPEIEFEVFVHGSMCISYSGRCLLSSYMTGRSANRGGCTQSCRWSYRLLEEERPGEYMPVYEDNRGSYIMSSKDLCLIGRIKELIQCGVQSFKIEGRMKSVLYLATTVSVYRDAIDTWAQDTRGFEVKKEWEEELGKVRHRGYTEAFFDNRPSYDGQLYENEWNTEYVLAGIVKDYDEKTGVAVIEQRNKFSVGDKIEVIGPGRDWFSQVVEKMTDDKNNVIDSARHARQEVRLSMERPVNAMDILRKPAG